MDEPAASQDPDTADSIRSYLEQYQRDTGASILLASHNMAEVERMATDVIMMRKDQVKDQVVDTSTPSGLLAKYGRNNLEEVFIDIARHKEPA